MFTVLLVFYFMTLVHQAKLQYRQNTEYRSSLSLSIVEVHKNLKFIRLKVSGSNVVNIYGT